MRRQRVSLPSTSVYSPSICCHLEARSDRGFTHREETRIPSKGQNNINAATLLAPLIFKVQALHDLLIQVVQPPSEHRRERLSVPLVLIATSGLLSSLSILFVVSTIVGVLSVVIAAVVRRYVQQATKEACVRECEERSEAFCFCYDKPKIHIMQLTKHPPTWAASFIITHQRHAFDGHLSLVDKKRPPSAPHTVGALLS